MPSEQAGDGRAAGPGQEPVLAHPGSSWRTTAAPCVDLDTRQLKQAGQLRKGKQLGSRFKPHPHPHPQARPLPTSPAQAGALTRSSGGRAQSASRARSSRNRGSAWGRSMVSTFTHGPGLEATVEGRTQLQGAGRPASCCLRPRAPRPGHTHSHLASRSPSRSHSWHCLARRSQSPTCSTPMSRQPGYGCRAGGRLRARGGPRLPRGRASAHHPSSTGPGTDEKGSSVGGKSQPRRQLEPPCTPGDEPQERKSGAKATSGCAAAPPCPDPGLTCVQVLQKSPKGHGVDL